MDFVHVSKREGIAEVALRRGKVNALNEQMVRELRECFQQLADDPGTSAITLTSQGPFFSFGLDIPEFLNYSKPSFLEFLVAFTDLYTYLFGYPKPVIAALNGHAVAGGCMLALACDLRIMVSGKARISLNEITFLREPVAEEMAAAERSSLREFADIWYSANTWKNLQAITIRS